MTYPAIPEILLFAITITESHSLAEHAKINTVLETTANVISPIYTSPFCFEGFEYCVESTIGGFGPVEKTYHLSRRRRWVRQRTMVADASAIKEKVGL